MNLVKAAELLKNAPENTLKQYLANPNGEFPEYLVASEIERRRDMRERYSAELSGKPPKTSIIQELLQRDTAALRQPQQPQMRPEAMGLGAVPPPPGMQLSQAPIMDAAQQPQQFYGGGAVAFADGGLANINQQMHEYMGFAGGGDVDTSAYNVNPQLMDVPEVANQDSFYTKAQNLMGPSALGGYQDVLTKERAKLEENKKNYLPDFLIQAGLGMATSKSAPLAAAAEGAAKGFQFYQQAKNADEQAARNLTESEFKFKQAERAEKAGLIGLSRQLYGDAVNQRNTALNYNLNAQKAATEAAHYRDSAISIARKNDIDEKQVRIAASHYASQEDIARQGLEATRAAREEAAAGRQEDRRIKALQLRGTLMQRKQEFENSLTMPGSPFQEQVKQLGKKYTGPALQAAVSRLKDSMKKDFGLKDLEDALAAYEK